MLVDDLILEESIGKGAFGNIYISTKKDNPKKYATKLIDREIIEDNPKYKKNFENEIIILKNLKHPNIVKFEELKKTKKHYYIIMEYCNGGELSEALKNYQEKYKKPFNEEIVQYLMRQIINAFKYIHGMKVIHRDIKLTNVLLNYEKEEDKKNLNILKATAKIIDFGLSCRMDKSLLKYSHCGTPYNMDPMIIESAYKRINKGYDMKADIWSLGTICYEMLVGKRVFDAKTMNNLIHLIEKGNYQVPTNLSLEVISFLNAMLQNDPNDRLDIIELSKHEFLTKNIKDFHKINVKKISNNNKINKINLNIKNNVSIWAIFNSEDEKKLINIKGSQIHINDDQKENDGIRGPIWPH